MDAIHGVLILATLATTLNWMFALIRLDKHEPIKDWEKTAPVGILILIAVIAFYGVLNP